MPIKRRKSDHQSRSMTKVKLLYSSTGRLYSFQSYCNRIFSMSHLTPQSQPPSSPHLVPNTPEVRGEVRRRIGFQELSVTLANIPFDWEWKEHHLPDSLYTYFKMCFKISFRVKLDLNHLLQWWWRRPKLSLSDRSCIIIPWEVQGWRWSDLSHLLRKCLIYVGLSTIDCTDKQRQMTETDIVSWKDWLIHR